MSRALLLLLVPLLVNCRASMGADARMDSELSGQGHLEASEEENPKQRTASLNEGDPASSTAIQDPPAASGDFALFGARHDFAVKDASGSVSCRCVSALVGPPSSGKLEWQGEMPRTKPEMQLMVALIPSNDCPSAESASYWGYRVVGDDVVILLESWKASRPRTLGAIVPKPPANGQVYLAPVADGLPFGKPVSGAGKRCALGNPGPKRTAPLESNPGNNPRGEDGTPQSAVSTDNSE